MTKLKFAVCGAGFWSQFQLAAWGEINNAICVAVCDSNLEKAAALASRFEIQKVYTDATEMIRNESLDFVDVISSPASHESLVRLSSENNLPVICQKPMAEEWDACERMVEMCRKTNTWFAIHENWRWQSTLRRVKQCLDAGDIGDVFRCRLDFVTGFDVFANQPTLRESERFIIADLGCHVIDYARCLFGEATSIYCRTSRVSTAIRGEDTATLSLWMNEGQTMVDINLAYAGTPLEDDCFPQTRLFAEGKLGSLELLSGYRIRVTTQEGTREEVLPPENYRWVDPRYAVVHSSMVACNSHFLEYIQLNRPAETDGRDNLRTMKLVFAAYESAARNRCIVF